MPQRRSVQGLHLDVALEAVPPPPFSINRHALGGLLVFAAMEREPLTDWHLTEQRDH
jgi:hypothetical protein